MGKFKELLNIHMDGQDAAMRGQSRDSNPYQRGEQEQQWNTWDIGWCQGIEQVAAYDYDKATSLGE